MAILTGINKVKTAVFISGNGSNLKSLIKFSRSNKSPISIKLIISNNSKAKGLSYGKIFKIKKRVINFKNTKIFDDKLISILRKNQIEMICLAGFMKILSKYFIKEFNGKIINIHPSLLPKYKGLNTHQKVLDNKEKYSGCTVHIVNSKLDSGKIILQRKVKISRKDDLTSLAKKVLKIEHLIYPAAIKKILH